MIQTSQGMNRKTGVPGENPISQTQRKPYDINLDEGFTATKSQKTKQPPKTEGETDRQRHRRRESYKRAHVHTGFLLPSLSIKCDSMSFPSFTLSVKRSHSPFTRMLRIMWPVWLK